jgi:hypothetical protein
MRLSRAFIALIPICLIQASLPPGAAAQPATVDAAPSKSVRAVRVGSAPVIDGRLDDAVWAEAEVIDDFHQTRPGDGLEPSERTEVYVVYDDDALYIGARMYDSEPDRIAAPTVRHGQGLGSDDRLVIILDPFNTGRTGYRFETNLNGVRHDALYEDVRAFRSDWTVIWETTAATFEGGWIAEVAIPFKTLPFDPAMDTWGFNFGRGIRRRGEEMAWVSRNRTYNPSVLGKITGLTGMDQGLGLDIVPALAVNRQKTFSPDATDLATEPSVDLFYRLTPSLNASLTVNTDFSAAEVDDRQVNLTRFGLFFPEKRDFFLNDGDLFQFGRIGGPTNNAVSGSSNNNGRSFFSRRIGLSSSGSPVDLNVGAKLSGRVGRWSLGALAIRQDGFEREDDDGVETVDPSTVFVGRVSANVLAESSIGAIVTAGDPSSNRDNAVAGVDFRYLNTYLPGGRVFEGDAWYQRSATEGVEGDESAFGLGIGMPNNSGLRGAVGVRVIQENFNPAVGFVSRTGVRDFTADVGYTHFPRDNFFQSLFFGVDGQHIAFIGGGLQSEAILYRLVDARTHTNEVLSVEYNAAREEVTEPFAIYEDNTREVVVPPGRYAFGETSLSLQTGGQRPVSGNFTYRFGDFYGGTRDNVTAGVTWRPFNAFGLTASYDRNAIDLVQGDFVTRLVRLETEVNFSSTLYWVTLVQYDDVSEVVGVNARLLWIPRAGQEGLFVVNHRLQDEDKDNDFRSERLDINLKLSYTFRF